ncbi:MAG: DNA polymerase I [Alphaproteobacteria bacterium]|nr:DNA polymerase I [Alphaproteobacteria bacterium]
MNFSNETIVLVDGSGYIFRAFFAIPRMTRKSDGLPVNAIYGFCRMLEALKQDLHCTRIAVAFDHSRQTFRQNIYSAYKANRPPVPEDLVQQFPYFRRAVDAFGFTKLEIDGYEADDLLATYAKLSKDNGAKVIVVSADKDLMQLMDEGISIYDPTKKEKPFLDETNVFDKFGVKPNKVIDVQSLCGDTIDNVPGVPGIGPKKASKLINEFGSLENLLDNLDSLKAGKDKDNLIANKELALISKKLVTLKNDINIDIPLDKISPISFDQPEALTEFYKEMNFMSLLKAPEIKIQYSTITNSNEANELANKIKASKKMSIIALSKMDKTSINTYPIGFAISYDIGQSSFIEVEDLTTSNQTLSLFDDFSNSKSKLSFKDFKNIILPLLNDISILKIGFNIKSLQHYITSITKTRCYIENFEDVQVMNYVLNGQMASLQESSISDLGFYGKNKIFDKYIELKKCSDELYEDYFCSYSDGVLRLYNKISSELKSNQNLENVYKNIDKPLISVLYDMEQEGIKISNNDLQSLSLSFSKKMNELEEQIYSLAGEQFNLNSPSQLGNILFDKLQYPGGKKSKTGVYSTDAEILQNLADLGYEIPVKMLEYRKLSKLKSTYTDALITVANPKTNRVHTNFILTGTNTGRLASNNPNLQNIPIRTEEGREIRKAFISEKGSMLLSADYSQIELRLMAHVANVSALKQAFLDNIDIHAATASQVFGIPVENMDPIIRRRAKAINFGIIYGISPFGLSQQLGITQNEAKEYIEKYFARFPEIKEYMEKTKEFAKQNGYVLTPFGRKCFIDKTNKNGQADRAAINAPIQGGAADMLKKAMIIIPLKLKEQNLSAKMLLQVHDELIFEIKEEEIDKTKLLVKDIMENIVKLSVPLIAEVGIGKNWSDAH